MTFPKRFSLVLTALGASVGALSLGASSSCVTVDTAPLPPATHVDDWRDEVIYQLMVDRFADGDPTNNFRVDRSAMARYHGGDWQGVIDRLDYLQELGVTTLWISPIVRNVDTDAGIDGYHGYWAQDLTKLNPHFGDVVVLKRLVRTAHERGMKVIVDIVTNHLGQLFYYDINMNGRPDESVFGSGTVSPVTRVTEYDPDYDPRGIQSFTSLGEAGPAPIVFVDMPEIFRVPPLPEIFQRPEAYNRRGRITDYGIREQVLYGDFPGGLKDVNTELPAVREAMVDVYARWAIELDLDGYRIDTLKHVEEGFWQYFAPELRRRLAAVGKNKFFLFGEAFDGDDVLVGSYTRPGMLDSVFYFPHKYQVFEDIFARGQATKKIETLFTARAANYGNAAQELGIGVAPRDALVNFIDNHDVARFLFLRPDAMGPRALRAALGYLLLQDGIPCLYYGTEQEFRGGNDPSNREDLWLSNYATDGETFRWIARLTALRRERAALRRGDFTLRWTTERTGEAQDAGIVAFERRTADDYALVVINAQGDKPSETSASELGFGSMVVTEPAGTTLTDRLSGETFTVGAGGELRVRVEPYGVRVLTR